MVTVEQFITDLKTMLGSDGAIDMETDLMEIEEWDSFSMMAFIAMAKEKYNAVFKPFAVAEAVLVEDLYDVIKKSLEKE